MSNTEKITEIKSSFNNMVDSFFGVIDEIHQQQKQEIVQMIKSSLNTKTINTQDLQEIVATQQIPIVNMQSMAVEPVLPQPKITAVITPAAAPAQSIPTIESIKAKYKIDASRFSKHGNAFLYRPLNLVEYKNILGNNPQNLKYHPIINDLNDLGKMFGHPTINRNDIGGWGFKLVSANDSFLFKKEFLVIFGIDPNTIITTSI